MPHTEEWKVRLYLFEEEGTTHARAVLDTGADSWWTSPSGTSKA